MTVHRLESYFRAPPSGGTSRTECDTAVSFVPCPAFAAMSKSQQTAVAEIYRIAAERTREQLRPRRAIPAFSLN